MTNPFRISHLDHLVLTVSDIETASTFYTDVLGMNRITFGEGRVALAFGSQKINLHQHGNEFEPKAATPTPGSADLCFITSALLDQVQAWLEEHHVPIEAGPVQRTGAIAPIRSLYFRDPDGNLIEVSNYVK